MNDIFVIERPGYDVKLHPSTVSKIPSVVT